jgi:hypothetical protein
MSHAPALFLDVALGRLETAHDYLDRFPAAGRHDHCGSIGIAEEFCSEPTRREYPPDSRTTKGQPNADPLGHSVDEMTDVVPTPFKGSQGGTVRE